MGVVFVAAALGATVFWLVQWQRGRSVPLTAAGGRADRQAERARLARIAALLLCGIGAAFYLMFAVGEIAGGETSGVQHIPPVLLFAGLIWLGWTRPRAAGIVLLSVSVPVLALVLGSIAVEGVRRPGELWIALLIPIVPVLTGLLFLLAGRRTHQADGTTGGAATNAGPGR